MTELINDMKKELRKLEDGTEVGIPLDAPRATYKKKTNFKTPDHDVIYGFYFLKNHIYS